MTRRLSAIGLLVILLVSAAQGIGLARTNEQIDADVAGAEERLEAVQSKIDTLDGPGTGGSREDWVFFVEADGSLVPLSLGSASRLADWVGLYLEAEADTTRQLLFEDPFGAFALRMLAVNEIGAVLQSVYGTADGAETPSVSIPPGVSISDFVWQELKEQAATVEQIAAERDRFAQEFADIEQEIEWFEEERVSAHGFPPGWIDGRPESLVVARLGEHTTILDEESWTFRVGHIDTGGLDGFTTFQDYCATTADGLHWCGLNKWTSVYQMIPGGLRRYSIETTDICDLIITDQDLDPASEFFEHGVRYTGSYSCVPGGGMFGVGFIAEETVDPMMLSRLGEPDIAWSQEP